MTDLASLIQLHRHARASVKAFDAMGKGDAAHRADMRRDALEKQIDAALVEKTGVGFAQLREII